MTLVQVPWPQLILAYYSFPKCLIIDADREYKVKYFIEQW